MAAKPAGYRIGDVREDLKAVEIRVKNLEDRQEHLQAEIRLLAFPPEKSVGDLLGDAVARHAQASLNASIPDMLGASKPQSSAPPGDDLLERIAERVKWSENFNRVHNFEEVDPDLLLLRQAAKRIRELTRAP